MPSLETPKESKLHNDLVARLSSRVRLAETGHSRKHIKWQQAEELCVAFVPETEQDGARRRSRETGKPSYTTIQVPYSYALLMSAHTYWTSVFFARAPVHQYQGRHGEGEQQVQAMEALIGYQVEVGGFMGPYYIWFYDAGKYGAGILGHYWDRQTLHYGELVEMADPLDPNASPKLYQVTKEVQGYIGNRVYNVSVWDFMHDPRVALKNFQRGEFCIARTRIGWSDIIRRKKQGWYNKNVDFLKGHLTDKGRTLGSSVIDRPQFDMTLSIYDGVEEELKHPSGATFYEIYIELIPDEWGLGKGLMFPQKWCFTITEDLSLVIGAQPMGYVHCQFPFDVLEPEVEGYGLYTRGFPEIMKPIQDTVDWLLNVHFYNVRASVNNQFIIDPSKIVLKDVQNSGPGWVWRLRPEAYGSDLTKIFTQVAVTDITKNNMNDFQAMFGVGERTLGVNDQIMGAMNTGATRKTATEVRTTTGFGINRQKTIAEYMSASAFAPHSQKLVQTSQQMYDNTQKLRRVGDLALEAGQQFLNVTPENIVGFFDMVPVDGTLPIDRMAQANMWKEILASVRMMPPQIAMGYDWMRIFGWAAQIGGLKNINQFRVQVIPDGMGQQMADAGNVIPMPQRPGLPRPTPVAPGNSASGQAGLSTMMPPVPPPMGGAG